MVVREVDRGPGPERPPERHHLSSFPTRKILAMLLRKKVPLLPDECVKKPIIGSSSSSSSSSSAFTPSVAIVTYFNEKAKHQQHFLEAVWYHMFLPFWGCASGDRRRGVAELVQAVPQLFVRKTNVGRKTRMFEKVQKLN